MIPGYWANLNERERWMVGSTAICVFIYLFYLLIYSPLADSINTKSKQLIEKRETLVWMEQVKQQPKNQKIAQPITNAKLLALVGNQLSDKSYKPFPYQLQQTGTGDIQLSFDSIPYGQFLTWLWNLCNDYAISLKQFTAERNETPGLVKVLIVITAK